MTLVRCWSSIKERRVSHPNFPSPFSSMKCPVPPNCCLLLLNLESTGNLPLPPVQMRPLFCKVCLINRSLNRQIVTSGRRRHRLWSDVLDSLQSSHMCGFHGSFVEQQEDKYTGTVCLCVSEKQLIGTIRRTFKSKIQRDRHGINKSCLVKVSLKGKKVKFNFLRDAFFYFWLSSLIMHFLSFCFYSPALFFYF